MGPMLKRMSTALALIALIICAYVFVGALFQGADCRRCNVIIISIDSLRADHMSLYGYERITTPNLDDWSDGA